MWLGKPRAKTSIRPRSFLTPEAIESVDEYLKLLEKKYGKLPKYLWCNSNPDKHITNEGLNKKFRRLVTKANIKTYNKKVHFHLLRKFTFSRLRRIDRDIAKIICGKKVSASDMTYEEIDSQCEKVFKLAYKDINLNGDVLGKRKQAQQERMRELERAIKQLERENSTLKTRITILQDEVAQLDGRLAERDVEIAKLERQLRVANEGISQNKESIRKLMTTLELEDKEEV